MVVMLRFVISLMANTASCWALEDSVCTLSAYEICSCTLRSSAVLFLDCAGFLAALSAWSFAMRSATYESMVFVFFSTLMSLRVKFLPSCGASVLVV